MSVVDGPLLRHGVRRAGFVLAYVATGALLGLGRAPAIALAAILFAAGAVVICRQRPGMSRSPSSVRHRYRSHSALLPFAWFGFAAAYLILSFDLTGFFTGISPGRYAILFVPLICVAASMAQPWHSQRITREDALLIALVVWGLSGALYGKLVTKPHSSSLTIILPMTAAFVHCFERSPSTEAAARRMLNLLALLGALFVAMYFITRIAFPFSGLGGFTKERSFLLAVAPMAALVAGRRRIALLEVMAIIAIFLEHPAATFPATAAVVAFTIFVLSSRSALLRVLAVLTFSASVLLGFTQTLTASDSSTLTDKYFSVVNKANNTSFRTDLLNKGIAEIGRSPLYGTNFTGELAIRTSFPGEARFAPPHNDYLQLAMGGGLIALTMYVAWFVLVNRRALKTYRYLTRTENKEQAALLRVLLVGFNGFLAGSLFNPLLAGVGTAAAFFLLSGAIMTLCRHATRADGLDGVTGLRDVVQRRDARRRQLGMLDKARLLA